MCAYNTDSSAGKTPVFQLHRMSKDEFRQLEISFTISDSPFGRMVIASTDKGICYLSFGENTTEGLQRRFPFSLMKQTENTLIEEVKKIVEKWGDTSAMSENTSFVRISEEKRIQATDDSTTFNNMPLPLHLYGTEFQVEVWHQLLSIPFAQLTTYKAIADQSGRPKAVRATGTAIGNNPVALLIPCHRVVTSAGKTGGYRWGMVLKSKLIELEKSLNIVDSSV